MSEKMEQELKELKEELQALTDSAHRNAVRLTKAMHRNRNYVEEIKKKDELINSQEKEIEKLKSTAQVVSVRGPVCLDTDTGKINF